MATKEITEDSKAESNETGEEITDLESDIHSKGDSKAGLLY